jgi:hypothetical protein
MSGPPPKSAHLRQRTNRKSGAGLIEAVPGGKTPPLPNPDGRTWHPLTLTAWKHAWSSPMAGEWLETDADAIGRLALLWDEFYKAPDADGLKEIRLQSALFGLSPLDRSRLQWEVARGEEAESKHRRQPRLVGRTGTRDPRAFLMAVKG